MAELGRGLVRQRRAVVLQAAAVRAPSFPPNGSNYGFYNNPATNDLIEQASPPPTSRPRPTRGPRPTSRSWTTRRSTRSPTKWATYHATQVHNAIYLTAMQAFDPANVWLDPAKNGG